VPAEVGEDLAEPGFIVGQGSVVEPFARPVQGNGVMVGFADVQADENVDVLLVKNHCIPPSEEPSPAACAGRTMAAAVGIHVTNDPASRASISDQLPPGRSRWQHPLIMKRLGATTVPGPTGQHTLILQQERATKR
jgi:hypothetical protein